MKILLFGATGRLGKRVKAKLSINHEVITPTHTQMPVESTRVSEYIDSINPRIIINCSAMNGLEECRENPRQAMEVNCMAVGTIAAEAMRKRCGFVHFSTDYAEPAIDVYGATKYAGEKLALIYSGATVFRLMSIYDPADMAGALSPVKKFMAGKGKTDSPIRVFYQITAPTFTGWIADVIGAFVDKHGWKDAPGLYHLAPYGQTSKKHFGYEAVEKFCGSKFCVIEVGADLPIPRPHVSLFKTDEIQRAHWLVDKLKVGSLPSIRENLDMAFRVWQNESHAGVGSSTSNSA